MTLIAPQDYVINEATKIIHLAGCARARPVKRRFAIRGRLQWVNKSFTWATFDDPAFVRHFGRYAYACDICIG